MYAWRKMTVGQKEEALKARKNQSFPWHGPPHFMSENSLYHVTAACYEHKHIIGYSVGRMAEFEKQLLKTLSAHAENVLAWCVLPNHYHVLVRTLNINKVVRKLGQLHGSTSFYWNTAEAKRGRKCWHRCVDRAMRTERHQWVTLNYIHHNPVHHQYVDSWQDWPFSSAKSYLESVSHEIAKERWVNHPLKDYGKGWDDPDI